MQTATSETESKFLDLSICVHHYTLRAPCPKGQGNHCFMDLGATASVAKSLFHWLRRRLMMLKRMLRIQFL